MTTLATNNRAAARSSTYSGAPSLHPSLASTTATESTTSNHPRSQASETKRNTMTTTLKPSAVTYDNEKVPVRSESIHTTGSNDSRSAEIKQYSGTLERMQDVRLDKQRYIMSGPKGDEIHTNALGAKLERALGRRMVGQDAVFTRRGQIPSKRAMELQA